MERKYVCLAILTRMQDLGKSLLTKGVKGLILKMYYIINNKHLAMHINFRSAQNPMQWGLIHPDPMQRAGILMHGKLVWLFLW